MNPLEVLLIPQRRLQGPDDARADSALNKGWKQGHLAAALNFLVSFTPFAKFQFVPRPKQHSPKLANSLTDQCGSSWCGTD